MRIMNRVTSKAMDFNRLIEKLCEQPVPAAYQMILTAYKTGFYAGENFLTRLRVEEAVLIKQLHERLTKQADDYRITECLDLSKMLPKYLGIKVSKAAYVGFSRKTQKNEIALVLLQGGSVEQLVEARMFLTCRRRHPKAIWYFSASTDYYSRPIILVSEEGWHEGELVAAISPANLGKPEHNEDADYLIRKRKLDEASLTYWEI